MQLRISGLHKSQKMQDVAALNDRRVATFDQALRSEFANGLRHDVPRLAVLGVLLAKQALFDQPRDPVQRVDTERRQGDGCRARMSRCCVAQRLSGLQCETAEHRQPAEERLLVATKEIVAPGNRVAERLLALR